MKSHGRYISLTSNVGRFLIPAWHFLSIWCIFCQENKQRAVLLSSKIGQSILLTTSANNRTKKRKTGWSSICRVESKRFFKYFRKSYCKQSRRRRYITQWHWQSSTRLHQLPFHKSERLVRNSLKHGVGEGLLSSLSGLWMAVWNILLFQTAQLDGRFIWRTLQQAVGKCNYLSPKTLQRIS
jgi:hypothetical protein